MKIGTVRQIQKEDLGGGDIPAFVDPLLSTLNQFISSVASALQNRLTFNDNFLSKTKQIKFESGVEKKISTDGGRLRAIGLIPIQSAKPTTSFYWTNKDDGSVGVTFTFDGGGEALCKFLILFGEE